MTREQLEEKVQDLIDGRLSESEAREIENQIQKDDDLSLLYSTLTEVDQELQSVEPLYPMQDFTERVMSRLHTSGASTIDFKSIWVFIGVIVCIVAGIIFASQAQLTLKDFFPVSQELTIPDQLPLLDKIITLPEIKLPSSEILLNSFYFGLLFLAMIYLDRVILRPLFRNKRYSV